MSGKKETKEKKKVLEASEPDAEINSEKNVYPFLSFQQNIYGGMESKKEKQYNGRIEGEIIKNMTKKKVFPKWEEKEEKTPEEKVWYENEGRKSL